MTLARVFYDEITGCSLCVLDVKSPHDIGFMLSNWSPVFRDTQQTVVSLGLSRILAVLAKAAIFSVIDAVN